MVVKAAIGFLLKDSDDKLVKDVQAAITGMTDNANFPKPTPALADVTSALTAFTVALADTVNGGKEMTSIKNANRAQLASLMRQLASYVTETSNGDMTKLLSSGFPYQKPNRVSVGTLPAPGSPLLRQGALSGQLDAKVPPIYGAYTFNWRLALASAPNTYVQTVQTTAARCTFPDLTPGQTYNVQVNAVGTAGESNWSGVGSRMVI